MSLDTRGVQIPNGSKNPDDEQFLIIAEGFDDFERAMREKLLMEIYPKAFLAENN
jgi:hypothetical protein